MKTGCKSVAFTYNDPTIFLEYAVDIAQACIALKNGIRYAYTGNVHDFEGESTCCHNCGTACAGVIDGPPGNWGPKRQRVIVKPSGG